jgi:uncharacterized membrane protein YbhN (UPF0104 family)
VQHVEPAPGSARAPDPAVRPAGAGWRFWARAAVSVGLLALLVANVPDLDGALPRTHHLRTGLLLTAAVSVTLLGVILSAWRWQRVLLVFDAHVPLRTLVSHYLAGLFLGNVLPSTIGGDVLRIARCSATTGSGEVGFASVAIERLTGFIALPALVLAGFLARPSLLDADGAWLAITTSGGTLGVLTLVLVLAGHPRLAGRFAGNESWTRFIGAVHSGVDRMRTHPPYALAAIGTALVYQVSVVCSVLLVFETLDLSVPVAGAFAFVPAVMMLQVLPVSFNGLGVREGLLVLFLRSFGVSSAQAIAAGLLWFTTTLVVSMLGAPAFAVGHRRARHRGAGTAG